MPPNARALHERALILLAHDHEIEADDFAAARLGGVTAKILHAVIDVEMWSGRAAYLASRTQEDGVSHRAMRAFDRALSFVEANPTQTLLVTRRSDVRDAKLRGALGLVLGMEGGRALEASLEVLRCYFRLGLRHVQFNWGVPNRIAACQHELGDADGGLSEFGRSLLAELNRLGVLADTGHSSQRTRMQTYELSRAPVLHSHGGAAALNPLRQNLTDEELKALAANGGVIGLHFMNAIIGVGEHATGTATFDDLFAHINHIARVAGMQIIGLGPDYLAYNQAFVESTDQPGMSYVRGLERVDRLPRLTQALLAHGYRETDVEAILGGNLLRVFDAVLPS